MKKILITIANNTMTFSYKNSNSKISTDLINTNIISDNELIFTDTYIEDNIKIVSAFIKELIIQYNINQINVENINLTLLVLNIISILDTINALSINDESTITYAICEKLIEIKKITSLSCFNIPTFMLEMLDKHNIKVVSRSEILFTSSFMQCNNLKEFSKIYYKMSVRIELPFSKLDRDDFITFCKINRYLKTIHLNIFNVEGIEFIIKTIKENKLKNIKIILHENITNEKHIEYLRKLNKKILKYKIMIKLEYSESYLENNIFRQALANTLKICGILLSLLIICVISYIGINNYNSLKEVAQIKDELKKVIEITDNTEIVEEIENEVEKTIVNDYIASLLTVNPDTVGWLKVNDTNIDYPVVQSTDNKYYLDNNFNGEEDHDGWVFMDYRNDPINLSKNTIIYGHNRYYSGVMFGTLYKTAYRNWYGKEENQIISFDTLYGNMRWQIFSIYKIEKTSDYLKVNFSDSDVWKDFINMIKNRSIYDFGVDVGEEDKILTLSTCSSNRNIRLVIHAKLITEE